MKQSKMAKRYMGLATAAAAALTGLHAQGATYLWDSGTGADQKWSTATNWSGDVLPTFDANADLVFPNGAGMLPASGNVTLDMDGSRTIRSLTLGWDRANTLILNSAVAGKTLTLVDVTRTANTVGNSRVEFFADAAASRGAIVLADHSTWNLLNSGTNPTTTVYGTISDGGSGYSLTKLGAGTLQLEGDASYTGATRVFGGTLIVSHNLNANPSGKISASSKILVANGGKLQHRPWADNSATWNLIADATPIKLGGGTFSFAEGVNVSVSGTENIGALTFTAGQNVLMGSGRAGVTQTLQGTDLTLETGATLRFAPSLTGPTVFKFSGTVPTAVGGGGGAGTTNRSILPGIFAGTSATTGSLTYYDATNGLSLLNRTTEFATSIDGVGATTDQNVRRSSSEALTADRTLNALVIDTASSPAISGAFNLTLGSGMLLNYAGGTTAISTSSLRFGGGKGYIVAGNNMNITAAIQNATDMTFSVTANNTTITVGATGNWSGKTYINGPSDSTNTGTLANSGSERLPDATTVVLGQQGRLLIANSTTETIGGLAGVGTASLNGTAAQLVVGSGTGVGNRIVVGTGVTAGTLAPGMENADFKAGTLALRPNSTAGGVTLGGNAIVNIDLGGYATVDYDVVQVQLGDLVLGGTLNVNALAGFTPVVNDSWIIMTAEKKGVATVSGSFASVTLGYQVSLVDTNADTFVDAVKLTAVAIPEPASLVLMGVAGLLMMPKRRRAKHG